MDTSLDAPHPTSSSAWMLVGSWAAIMLVSWGTMVGLGSPPLRTLVYNVLGWAPWVPLTVGLHRLTGRLPFEPGAMARVLAAHVVLSLVWIAVYSVYIVALGVWTGGGGMDDFGRAFEARLGFWLFFDWLFYFGVVAAVYAFAHFRSWAAAEQRVLTAQRETLAAQARARAQLLRPHFLFNALNGLNGLIRSGETDSAARVVDGLSGLLRYSLDAPGDGAVRLQREFEAMEAYVDVQRIRFDDRLEVAVTASSEALAVQVPAFVLQPLVENAVEHGESERGVRRVEVDAHVDRGRVHIRIENRVRAQVEAGHGLGLESLRARLEQWADGSGRVQIEVGESVARVELDLPEVRDA